MLELKEYGDWSKAAVMLEVVANKKVTKAVIDEMNIQAEKIRKKIVEQIDSQNFIDTPEALKPSTIARKKGDDRIYINTGKLRNGIIAYAPRHSLNNYTVAVTGSPNQKSSHSGDISLSTLMKYLEYGTSTIHARPLFKPTWESMKKDVNAALSRRFHNSLSSGSHGYKYDSYRGMGDGSGK